jgi:hypothetical protein
MIIPENLSRMMKDLANSPGARQMTAFVNSPAARQMAAFASSPGARQMALVTRLAGSLPMGDSFMSGPLLVPEMPLEYVELSKSLNRFEKAMQGRGGLTSSRKRQNFFKEQNDG